MSGASASASEKKPISDPPASGDEAPPPYTRHASAAVPGGSGGTTTTVPALPHPIHAPAGPKQHLHVYRDSLFNHDLTIMAPDKKTIAFTVSANSGSMFSSTPHMRVYRGPVETHARAQPVGTVTFRPFRGMDLTFHGRPVGMEAHGIIGRDYVFIPSPDVGPLTWVREGLGSGWDMYLVNAQGRWMAKYESRVSVDKRGVLEVGEWEIGTGQCLDEVVTSLVALVELQRRRRL